MKMQHYQLIVGKFQNTRRSDRSFRLAGGAGQLDISLSWILIWANLGVPVEYFPQKGETYGTSL